MGQAVPAIPSHRRSGGPRIAPGAERLVPVARVRRTSTSTTQDPVKSLTRQGRVTDERLPGGFYVVAEYWDVESGGTDLDARSMTAEWEPFARAGIPRDGGVKDLRAALAAGNPPFAAVISETTARLGRDMYDALRLEKELRTAGIMVLAADEPIDTQAPEGSTILVRRIKQAEAEYFRYNLKTQMWEGLKQYVIGGFNTGRAPYGYAEDRTPHPNPLKASMGATRARLVPHPEQAAWVRRIFEWRAVEKLSVPGIARRLTALGVPNATGKTTWNAGAVYVILANPKYTGRVVLGRRTNTGGPGRGEQKIVTLPREYWTWAADENAHEAIIDAGLWEEAQTIGKERGNTRDPGTRDPRAKRIYPYRSRIWCRECGKRMAGHASNTRRPGHENFYYVCSTNPRQKPADAAQHPGHPRVATRQDVFTRELSQFMDDTLFSPDRRERLAELIPATQLQQDRLDQTRIQALTTELKKTETALDGITAEMEQLAGKQDPATRALRDRLTQRFSDRYDQAQDLRTRITELENAAPAPGNDLTLLDELPHAAGLLALAPPELQERIAAAFDLHAVYRAELKQATIRLTITAATPVQLNAILADPRIDDNSPATSTTTETTTGIATSKPSTSENTYGDPAHTAMAISKCR
jgi:DNA invertase Pin-like site-specific DNA recombinase